MSEEKILIPAKFYIGFNERSRYEDAGDTYDWRIPLEKRGAKIKYRLGFATYYEDSARFRNRQSTVDGWANPSIGVWVHQTTKEEVAEHELYKKRDEDGYDRHDWSLRRDPIEHLQPQIIDNTPISGFRIPHEVSRDSRWHRNTVWRMVDPRGWELEITSGNMASIMEHVGIGQGGIIQGECVWAWSMTAGGKLILLPVTSPQYLVGIKHTTRVAKKVSLKDVQLGDEVELANGTTGTWLGAYNLLTQEEDARYSNNAGSPWDGKTRRSFLALESGKYYIVGSPKISSITKKTSIPLNADDILKEINTAVRKKGTNPFTSSDHSTTPHFIFAYQGSLKVGDYELKLRPVSEETKKTGFTSGLECTWGYRNPVWFLDQSGSWYVFHVPTASEHGARCRYGGRHGRNNFFGQPQLGTAGFAELDYGIWDPQNLKVGYEHHSWDQPRTHRSHGYHYGGHTSLEEMIAKSEATTNQGANPFAQRGNRQPYVSWDQIDDDVKCVICKEFAKTTPYFVSEVEDLEWKEPVIDYDGEEYPIHI